MDYKLIVTDMDGTLLGSDHEVTEENKKALKEALDKGINVTVATGRMYSSAKSHISFLNSTIPIIACNGALIKDSITNEIIYSNHIDKEKSLKVLKILEKYKVYYQYYSEDLLMCKNLDKDNKNLMKVKKLMNSGVDLVLLSDLTKHIISKGILKVIVIEDENLSILDEITKELNKIEGLEITKSWFNNIEIMATGSDKGSAVKILAEYLDIDKDNIIAFGDNYNDISMLEFAGIGVAMGNADEFVKSKADYITSTNSEDGVAKALYELTCLKALND